LLIIFIFDSFMVKMQSRERRDLSEWQGRVIFRPVLKSDLNEILKIEKQSFPTPWSREMFSKELELGFSYHRLLELKGEGKILAYIFCWLGKDEASILSLAVAPEWRRKGLGSYLLSKMLAELKKSGINWVWLEVRPSNLPAQALYTKFGFKEAGVRPLYYRDTGEDALVMKKELG